MATEIKMPQLSDTMYSGKILVWRKAVGDQIKRGDVLAEVETDKANLEIESFSEGTLLSILVPAEKTAQVGQVIAYIGQPGEQISANGSNSPQLSANETKSASPITPVSVEPMPLPDMSSERVKISPLAKKIAEQKNIDLSQVTGSGPQGRIIARDLESARPLGNVVTSPSFAQAPQPSAAAPAFTRAERPTFSGQGSLTPLSKMRETIAKRMQQSVQEAPHFYTTVSICMDQTLMLREVLKKREEYKGVSVNHFVIKAAAYALQHEPRVNCAMRDGQLYQPAEINIGIITALDDGLLIPVIKNTNLLPLRDVVFEARAAIERARAGRPSSNDLVGGTFSISNMGMFEVENFTAIINPGQGAVLAVSAVQQEPIVRNGQIVPGSVMKTTLSVDHRIIDGIMSANFLKYFKEGLEMPALLMN